MTITGTKLTLSQIAAQVAEEWAEQGKPTALPPDSETMTPEAENEFWDEVQTRFDAQVFA